MTNSFSKIDSNNFTKISSSSSPLHQNTLDNSFLFVLDLTSSLRFEAKREIIKRSVILPILQQFSAHDNLSVTFCGLTGSISLGLFCKVLATFSNDSKTFSDFLNEIDRFLAKEIDKIIDFGATGDSLTGNFGIGGTVESICTALCHFNPNYPENFKKHLILLPTSFGTEILPLFRTCYDDNYASASLPQLLSILRTRKISLSLIAPGLGDSTVVEQFIVFKCNEKIGNASKLSESLGSDWVVRLSAGLTGDESASPTPKAVDENELLNQTLIKLSTMPPDERVVALKTLLDPATSTFSSSFRQKFAAAVKSRLQSQESSSNSSSTAAQNNQSSSVLTGPPSRPVAFNQRRASHDASTIFWNGCIRFLEKQQSFIFRVQFVAVESQSPLPRASLENWPQELNLTGLLDSKKESIQSGLTVGYAFKVNVAAADTAVASYLMTRMCQGPLTASSSVAKNVPSPSHFACFRISQDVLIMLKVLSHDDLQFIGYLIDRRFPKNNLTPASQAASNAINSLTSTMKSPMTTTLSTGMDGLSLGRRPSFDMKNAFFPAKPPVSLPIPVLNSNRPPPQQQQQQSQAPQIPKSIPTMTTNYISYPQFIQQQQQQRSPAKIPAISSTTFTTNQLLTDPQAILQKLRPVVSQRIEPIPPPMQQPNEGNSEQQQLEIVDELDQSFVDAWLN